jgi:hypothetical protein
MSTLSINHEGEFVVLTDAELASSNVIKIKVEDVLDVTNEMLKQADIIWKSTTMDPGSAE